MFVKGGENFGVSTGWGLVSRALAPGGLMVVQARSPYSTPIAFWRTVSTIEAGGYAVTPYHVYVPTFGDWGFALAAKPAAAALSQPIGTRRGHSVRRRCATPHTRAVNAGTPARRRGHAPRLRLALADSLLDERPLASEPTAAPMAICRLPLDLGEAHPGLGDCVVAWLGLGIPAAHDYVAHCVLH